MTCDRCMDVIDAGPFVSHSREQLEAAQAHIQRCDRCATALGRTESLTTRLESMPSPGPSRDLTQDVMARIASLDAPEPEAVMVEERVISTVAPRGSRWLPTAGVVAAMAATAIITTSVSTPPQSIVPPVAGFRMALFAMPGSLHELLVGALGAMLYAFGVFAPQRGRGL